MWKQLSKSCAENLLMGTDLTLVPSFKVKQWFTGFSGLSFRWLQICILQILQISVLRCVGLVCWLFPQFCLCKWIHCVTHIIIVLYFSGGVRKLGGLYETLVTLTPLYTGTVCLHECVRQIYTGSYLPSLPDTNLTLHTGISALFR